MSAGLSFLNENAAALGVLLTLAALLVQLGFRIDQRRREKVESQERLKRLRAEPY